MAYTLVEAAKREENQLLRGIMEMYGQAAQLLDFLPLQDIDGSAYTYNTRTKLPTVGFRGIGETFTPSSGVVNPQTESLRFAGGEIEVDNAIIRTQAGRSVGEHMATESEAQAMAFAKMLSKKIIKGDSSSDPREFDGLQRRLINSQLIAQGSSSGGDALTLAKLDEAIDAVVGTPDVLVMNKTMRRKVNSLIRAAGQAQEQVTNQFGRQFDAYRGIPIAIVEEDETDVEILDFDEAAPGGGSSVCTSIYPVRFGADQFVSLLQGGGGMSVQNFGEIPTKPAHLMRVEWYVTLAVFHGRSASRLYGIKNA